MSTKCSPAEPGPTAKYRGGRRHGYAAERCHPRTAFSAWGCAVQAREACKNEPRRLKTCAIRPSVRVGSRPAHAH